VPLSGYGKSLNRLRSMGWHEIYTRGRQEIGKRRDVLLDRLGLDPFREPATQPSGVTLDCAGIVEILRRRMPDETTALVARAERILDGCFDLLGYRDLHFDDPIDWAFDPVHGKHTAPLPWPAIDFLNFENAGDHKIVWELNRHQVLTTLARAYRVTGEPRFAARLKNLWYDWRGKNPYPMGINWTSTLEVAFRAMSWMWVATLLSGTPADSTEFQQDLARETARAGWYIERFLSAYFSPNTHLLGEALALLLIGTRYPGLRHAARWRAEGRRIVLEESRRQVRADGLHFEQSTYYHVYALDMFLHARVLAGVAELDGVIRDMLGALAALSRAGALPRFGDDDGGRLFDGSRHGNGHMLDPLSTGAALYGDAAFKAASPGLIEETLWLLGPESAAAFDAIPPATPPVPSEVFAASGIYAMASPGPPVAQLFLDAGELGALAAGHGHADALSVQLAAGGRLWLADPGTCGYMGPVRDRFRGTRAHNTLTVDGLDQADPRGPFAWGTPPRVTVSRWESREEYDLVEARHSGYERLAEPVTHRRWVVRSGDVWLVRDVAEGRGPHDLEIHWHFAPELAVMARGAAVVARHGDRVLALVPAENAGWELTIAPGEYSPAYGSLVAAPVACWSALADLPAEFAVAIAFGADAPAARLTRRAGDSPGSVVYEYLYGGQRRAFVFSADGSARII
jgi:hypothetical protein